MLQRSTHEAAVDVPDIPATVQPGETVDWPHPVAGFESVEDAPAPEAEAPKTPRSKKAAPAPAPTGEEPQP
ncbi:hypothetical protein [Streptomyces sp. CBMA152]|uniref:hypothetical protein n=1 Tax=Streptomyces sp. CBMA152 TaxID=1896312 RepID=UPI0016607D47|nr:hypothetical protein [Streptomyces sp. CBMA152]MBD0743603.1 hypothetical protein [Streptomyces sp. CBMA152]